MKPALHQVRSGPPIDALVNFFETLVPECVVQIDQFYAGNARFKDPFNDVKGTAEIQKIFHHMFTSLTNPRFVVIRRIVEGNQCFLSWEFHFCFRGFRPNVEQVVLGASHLVFDDEGLITQHRDYWDAAEELYEKLPVIGILMRWLKRRAKP